MPINRMRRSRRFPMLYYTGKTKTGLETRYVREITFGASYRHGHTRIGMRADYERPGVGGLAAGNCSPRALAASSVTQSTRRHANGGESRRAHEANDARRKGRASHSGRHYG